MGHLINPIAFRLGLKKNWEYKSFIKNIYYSEYLHNILNIRNFIYYFFNRKKIIKIGVFLSHLNIFKYNKLTIIKIFIYNIDLEKASYSYINEIYRAYYKSLKNKKIKFPQNFFLMHNSDAYVFIFVFFNLFFKFFKKKKIKKYKYKYIRFFKKDLNEYSDLLLNKYNKVLGSQMKVVKLSNKKEEIIEKTVDKENLESDEKFLIKFENKMDNIINTSKLLDLDFILNLKMENLKSDRNYILKNNSMVNYFFNFFLYLCRKVNFKKFKNSFDFDIKFGLVLRLLKLYKFINYKKKTNKLKNNYYNYFCLFIATAVEMSYKLKLIGDKFYIRDSLYTYIYVWLGKRYIFPYFVQLTVYWKLLFFYISKLKNINFYYYFLSNDDITASFLTKYIGLKLQKGYYIFYILNPIKRELNRLYKRSKIKKIKNKYMYRALLSRYKSKFINKLFIINLFLNIKMYIFYKLNKNFINFDIIEFNYYIYKELKAKSWLKKKEKKKM